MDKKDLFEEIETIRNRYAINDHLEQMVVDEIVKKFTPYKTLINPKEKDEFFSLLNKEGFEINVLAPRWICHLFGFKHRAVHLLVFYRNQNKETVFIFQVRAFGKYEYPGHVDISVGGHVIKKDSSYTTVLKEMSEELGVTNHSVEDYKVKQIGFYDNIDIDENIMLHNNERRDLYIAEVSNDKINQIIFKDLEVVGLYLCPKSNANSFLEQSLIPIANALKTSLPYYLDYLRNADI